MRVRILIILVTIVAILGVLYFKTIQQPQAISAPTRPSERSTQKATLYLFHNPKDQDEECREIYAFADRAEKELADKLIVKRPDPKVDEVLLKRYSIRVLPTILIASTQGDELERFEGEGEVVSSNLHQMMERWKKK